MSWSPRDAGRRSPGLCPPVPAKRHMHPSPESYRKAILQELNQEKSTARFCWSFPSHADALGAVRGPEGGRQHTYPQQESLPLGSDRGEST